MYSFWGKPHALGSLLSGWIEFWLLPSYDHIHGKVDISDLMIYEINPSDYSRLLDGIKNGSVIDSRESIDRYLDQCEKQQ